ncbi:mandelate racemase/muconate lactonizing enzyme family protein [Rubrobacter taiwanensis]|uniref:Mandelate racemase/muconate lactonizing enzyme family protein n=1 Tax=Rubrobacter taiwanensis TaxID=185139 RepID=A0A4R1BHV8_9ACTN|nr:mandelate racemase/muconate lactonizing enzyme family protein [Rubrobacter taiwanensis]TCJ16843.1 mandelate racemase/muconate lactonizing enzyme family protein [Rubrobacter taiwanensis]
MKIASVETIPVKHTLKEPFGNGQGWTTSRQYLIVRVTSSDGIAGYGECWGPIAGNDRVVGEIIAPLLIGQDPTDTARLWEQIHFKLRWAYHSFAPYSALSGVDIALWDLKGKLIGQPVHKLLGGAFRDSVPAYATGHYFRRVDRLEDQISAVLQEAKEHLSEGFKTLKLKIGLKLLGWGPEADIALMRALHEEVGSRASLMIDANCAYSLPEAIKVGRAAEELGVSWFEEPLPPDDLDNYVRLSEKLDIPVAAGESWALLSRFHEVFRRQAVSIAQPDVCSAGGITEVKRIADLAHALNVPCIPHVWGTPIALAASLHVLATLPRHALLEFDRSENAIREGLLTRPFAVRPDSTVAVPDGPGLGIEVDEEQLDRFRVAA